MLGLNALNQLNKIKAKTSVIAASHNKIHPNATMEKFAEKYPKKRSKVIEKAGDMSYLSKAPEINQLVINFLKKQTNLPIFFFPFNTLFIIFFPYSLSYLAIDF